MLQSLAWVMPITHQWCHGMLSQEYRNTEYRIHRCIEDRNAEILKNKNTKNPSNVSSHCRGWCPLPMPIIQCICNCRKGICKGGQTLSLHLDWLGKCQIAITGDVLGECLSTYMMRLLKMMMTTMVMSMTMKWQWRQSDRKRSEWTHRCLWSVGPLLIKSQPMNWTALLWNAKNCTELLENV